VNVPDVMHTNRILHCTVTTKNQYTNLTIKNELYIGLLYKEMA